MQIVVKAAQFLNFVHLMLFKLTFRCNTCQTLSFFKGALSDLRPRSNFWQLKAL